jgi:hypothetical protein
MNINEIIYQIKSSSGLNGFISSITTDTHLKEIIENITIPTFSALSPFNLTLKHLDVRSLERVQGYPRNTFAFKIPQMYLDKFKEYGVKVVGITQESHMDNMRFSTINNNLVPMGYSYDVYSDAMWGNAIKKNIFELIIFEFEEPNIIKFETEWNTLDETFLYGGFINLVLKCTHPVNLSTLTQGNYLDFLELATYDILDDLYQNKLKDLNIDIGSSRVELKLEKFENAAADRKEKVAQMRIDSSTAEGFSLSWQ